MRRGVFIGGGGARQDCQGAGLVMIDVPTLIGRTLKPYIDTGHFNATDVAKASAEDDLSALTSNSGTTLATTCLSYVMGYSSYCCRI